jgi:arylsulfatase A-like enzyme
MSHTNVLIIHTDQQRYDSLGCTGNPYADTSNIDRLAREGTLFTRHIAANPVCTPSRCSLLTGLYPPGHGSWANGIALARREHEHFGDCEKWMHPPEEVIPEIPTIADRFAEAGYRTASFGKLHLTPGQAHGHYGFRESFETWNSGANDDWRGPYYGFQHVEMTQGHGETPCFLGHYSLWLMEHHRDLYDRVAAHEKAKSPGGAAPVYQSAVPSELHHSRWLAERFAAYLDRIGEADGPRPFFAFIGFPDPHHPICPSHDLAELYEDKDVLPAVDPEGTKRPHMSNLQEVGHFTEEDRKNVRRYTNAMVKGIDLSVGRIVSALEEKGLLDETVIVFTSDHGEFLCDHALLTKQNVCVEPLIHVPFILRAPGQGLPSTWGRPMSNVDVLPTVMSLAGLEAPTDIDGCDVGAEVRGELEHQVFAYAFHEAVEYHNMAVYDGDYKLLYYPKIERTELYNLGNDPHEMTDLAAQGDQADRVRKLVADAAMGLMKHTRAIGHRVCPW